MDLEGYGSRQWMLLGRWGRYARRQEAKREKIVVSNRRGEHFRAHPWVRVSCTPKRGLIDFLETILSGLL